MEFHLAAAGSKRQRLVQDRGHRPDVNTCRCGWGVAYFADWEGRVIALSTANGSELWATEFDTEITAPLTVAGDTVLAGTEAGTVYGLAATTGEKLWQFQTGGMITGSPIVAGSTMYVSSHDGKLYAVTASPGG